VIFSVPKTWKIVSAISRAGRLSRINREVDIHTLVDGVTFVVQSRVSKAAFVLKEEVKVEEPGSIRVPIKNLYDWLNQVTERDILLCKETRGKVFNITLDKMNQSARFKGMEAGEYPNIEIPEDASGILTIDAEVLSRALKSILPFVLRADDRTVLNCVYFCKVDDEVALVAADGVRVARIRLGVLAPEGFNACLISRAGIVELIATLVNMSGLVDLWVQLDKALYAYQKDSFLIVLQQTHGVFPTLDQVIPDTDTHTTRVVYNPQLFSEMLRKCWLFCKELNDNTVKLSVNDDLAVSVFAEGWLTGWYAERAPGTWGSGEPLDIAMNCRMMQDAVAAMSASPCMLYLWGPHQAVKFEGPGVDVTMMPLTLMSTKDVTIDAAEKVQYQEPEVEVTSTEPLSSWAMDEDDPPGEDNVTELSAIGDVEWPPQ